MHNTLVDSNLISKEDESSVDSFQTAIGRVKVIVNNVMETSAMDAQLLSFETL